MKKSGTYTKCSRCKEKINCCCYFDKIDLPVLNDSEVKKIGEVSNFDFYDKISDNMYRLKRCENKCIFYKDDECIIYDIRPIDCQLYPYDIIKKDDEYYLIIYLISCIDVDEFIKENPCSEELINKIIPWIDEFTNEDNYTKLKNYKYKIIKKINI
jgi:hypothetical protein